MSISKPTVKQLYYLLGNISHRWYAVGLQLKFDLVKLDKIKADFDFATSDRKLIEIFDLWIEQSMGDWSTIIEAPGG